MKYIIFSQFNRYHLLFLTYLIVIVIKEIVKNSYKSTGDIIESFHKYFSYTISDIISIIPIIIIKIRSKSASKDSGALHKDILLQNLKSKYSDNTLKIDEKKMKKE